MILYLVTHNIDFRRYRHMEHIQQHHQGGEGTLKHYIAQLANGFEWKIIFSICGTLVSYIEGFYGSLLWGFLGLFALDLISGICKSKKNGIPISSKKLRESVTKLGAYMVLITALIIASKFETSFVPIVTVTYYYFIFTELKSILENVEEMGVPIPPILRSKVLDKLEEIDTNQAIAEQKIEEVKAEVESVSEKVDEVNDKL